MSQPGIGVMLRTLAGNSETAQAWKESVGKTIVGLSVKDDTCRIELPTHTLLLEDEGQSCCEHRYMVCDDKLDAFIGAKLLDATIENAPKKEGDDDVHEVQFLHVKTTKGSFTISNHNVHNGYYGGFGIVARIESKEGAS